ncbi:hypothetical protein [Actinoplanes nipponensis]|nr:hypothetical protein [Actinoplanes nipponensis]
MIIPSQHAFGRDERSGNIGTTDEPGEHWNGDPGDDEDQPPAKAGPVIPPEALAPLRDAFTQALQPQIDAWVKQIQIRLPTVKIDLPRSASPKVNDHLRRAILAAMPDTTAMLAQLSQEIARLPRLSDRLQLLTQKYPPNWLGCRINPVDAWPVMQDEGIPLVWVPRAGILTDLLASPDRDTRLKILVEHRAAIAEDCRAVLAEVTHPEMTEQVPLGLKAIDAFAAGHHESAQALAVVIVETVVTRLIPPKEPKPGGSRSKYTRIAAALRVEDPEKVTVEDMRLTAAMAPIGPFFVPWYPSNGNPAPEELSRHVAVHQAHVAHYTPGNAVVAVMLLASVLRALQEQLELTPPT